MSNTVKMGIIGVGNMGSAHAKSLFAGNINGMELGAVCDIAKSKRKWAEENLPGTPVFADYKEMIASGLVDTILIATPHYLHPVIACEAFEAGLNVLTEKPAGVYTSAVQKMNDAAQKSGKVFGIMWNQRTNPLFQRARQMILDGVLGQPKRLVWTVTNWYRSQAYYESGGWRATWAGEGGGVLLNQAPHNIDLWQWMVGLPTRVRAFCTEGKYHNIEVEDDATIYAEYENGASAVFITTTGEFPGTNRLEISGDRGKMVLENGELHFWKLDFSEREACYTETAGFPSWKAEESVYTAEETEDGHLLILRNFTNAILHGEPLIAPGTDGIRELTISNAAYLSSWTNDWVTLPLDEALFEQHLQQKIAASHTSEKKNGEDSSRTGGAYSVRWSVRW